MQLILYIKDKNNGSWILADKVHDFGMQPGSDNLLSELDKLDVDFKKLKGIGLAVKDAHLRRSKYLLQLSTRSVGILICRQQGNFISKKTTKKHWMIW